MPTNSATCVVSHNKSLATQFTLDLQTFYRCYLDWPLGAHVSAVQLMLCVRHVQMSSVTGLTEGIHLAAPLLWCGGNQTSRWRLLFFDVSVLSGSQQRISTKFWYDMIYFVNCNWVNTGGSSTVHIYTQTIHRTTQWNRIHRTEHT